MGVEQADVDRGIEPHLLRRHPPQRHRERDLAEQLPARRQAERATLGDLDEVVGEAESGAADRDAEHREALRVARAEHEERHGDRDVEDQAAHRGCAGLRVMLLGALLPNLLAELLDPQVTDELRSEEDRDQHRRHPGDQDLSTVNGSRDHRRQDDLDAHRSPPAPPWRDISSSATRSSPTAREPLTSTASPGRTRRSTSSIAASASGAQASGA